MKIGDYVVRKSYGGDILFRIEGFVQQTAILKGIDYRLLADAPLSDLTVVKDPETTGAAQAAKIRAHESMKRFKREARTDVRSGAVVEAASGAAPGNGAYFEMPGRILHLDGDGTYMRKSMQLYGQLRVPAHGVHCHESHMPELLRRLMPQLQPDIVVITGHDGVLKKRPYESLQHLSSYKNSSNFVQAVRTAREYERNRDHLIIVAGACQSHYEALLQAGANFASSPNRILIHALDPVVMAIKASRTPIRETIHLQDAIQNTVCGIEGMGGIETFGKRRVGMPRPGWKEKAASIIPMYGA